MERPPLEGGGHRATGIAPQGVTDHEAGITIEAVFLIFSPVHVPDEQVKILGAISRFTKDSFIYPNILKATSPKEASYLLQEWDSFTFVGVKVYMSYTSFLISKS